MTNGKIVRHNNLAYIPLLPPCIRPLQPDVMLVLEAMAEMELPPIESMPPDAAPEQDQATSFALPRHSTLGSTTASGPQ